MKGIDFLAIIGDIDEKYVTEIEENQDTKGVNAIRWTSKRMMSCAASLVLIATLSVVLYQSYVPTSEVAIQEEGIASRGIDIPQEAEIIEEPLEEEVVEIDESAQAEQLEEITEEVPVDDELLEEKNIFEKMFDKVVSFFKNLRSL